MARILVVDDSPTVALKLSLQLEAAGFQVSSERTGTKTLEAVKRDDPDLVMLDVSLADIEGPEVCRILKKYAAESKKIVPVLLYSSLSEDEMIALADVCGADGFVEKNCPFEQMLRKIDAHLRPGAIRA